MFKIILIYSPQLGRQKNKSYTLGAKHEENNMTDFKMIYIQILNVQTLCFLYYKR